MRTRCKSLPLWIRRPQMGKPDTWMPLVIRDYLADTGHLSTAEHGAYLLLLMTAWLRGGALPDDDAQLARITRASVSEWKKLRASLAPFFHAADGEWRQKRLTEELSKARAMEASAVARASNAAASRWGKDRVKDAPSNAPSIPQAMPDEVPDVVLEESPIPIPSTSLRSVEKKPRAKAAETTIPDGFAVSDKVRKWASGKGIADPDRYCEIFIGRNAASGKKYHDWDHALMNAIREDWYGLRPAKVIGVQSIHDRRAATAAAMYGGRDGNRQQGTAAERDITGESERVA